VIKNAARTVSVALLLAIACSSKANQPPRLFLDVKLVRPPGYRCGTPDNTSRPLYACSIDTAVINTNGKALWVFHKDKLLRSCRGCRTLEFKLEHLYDTVYVVAVDTDIEPEQSFDGSMARLIGGAAKEENIRIEVSP